MQPRQHQLPRRVFPSPVGRLACESAKRASRVSCGFRNIPAPLSSRGSGHSSSSSIDPTQTEAQAQPQCQRQRQWQHRRLRTIAGSAIPADLATAAAEASNGNGDDASAAAHPFTPALATNGAAENGAVSSGANRGQQHLVDVRQILSDPGIEGDPLQFLKVSEAYWKVRGSDCSFGVHTLQTAGQPSQVLYNRRGVMEGRAVKLQSERACAVGVCSSYC